MADNSTFIYNSLNLPIEEQRKYNLEKYHFLSGILDILTLHLQLIKAYNLTQDDIYKHFVPHKLNANREREKFNTAIAQLVGSGMIEIRDDGIVTMTEKGIEAYDCQLFHSIAANLYAADRSDHLAKVAIFAASVLSFVSIISSIIIAIITKS
jgi:hypothetical protein